jgi:hypothetical protein
MQICLFFPSILSFLSSFNLPHCSCRGLLLHLITLNDTHTHGRTPLDEGSARRRKLCASFTYKHQDQLVSQSVSSPYTPVYISDQQSMIVDGGHSECLNIGHIYCLL